MPLATAPFPSILFIIFFVLPAILFIALIVGMVVFFYLSRKSLKVWGTGVAVMMVYALVMTWVALQAGHERNHYMRVTSCNIRNVVGQTDDGESIRLTFSFLQSQSWGEQPRVQTINAVGEQNMGDISSICQIIFEQYSDTIIRFETNGLNKIQRIWFLAAPTETTTELWAIYDIAESSITFRRAEWIDDTDLNTPFWLEETTTNTKELNVAADIEVKVLCYSELCAPHVKDEVHSTLYFNEFLEVYSACITDEVSCPYYALGNVPHLFDVTLDSSGNIIKMAQIYIP